MSLLRMTDLSFNVNMFQHENKQTQSSVKASTHLRSGKAASSNDRLWRLLITASAGRSLGLNLQCSTNFKFQSRPEPPRGVQWSNPCTTSMETAFKTRHLNESNQNHRPRKAQIISFGFVRRFMWKNVGPYSAKCFNPNCWISSVS